MHQHVREQSPSNRSWINLNNTGGLTILNAKENPASDTMHIQTPDTPKPTVLKMITFTFSNMTLQDAHGVRATITTTRKHINRLTQLTGVKIRLSKHFERCDTRRHLENMTLLVLFCFCGNTRSCPSPFVTTNHPHHQCTFLDILSPKRIL